MPATPKGNPPNVSCLSLHFDQLARSLTEIHRLESVHRFNKVKVRKSQNLCFFPGSEKEVSLASRQEINGSLVRENQETVRVAPHDRRETPVRIEPERTEKLVDRVVSISREAKSAPSPPFPFKLSDEFRDTFIEHWLAYPLSESCPAISNSSPLFAADSQEFSHISELSRIQLPGGMFSSPMAMLEIPRPLICQPGFVGSFGVAAEFRNDKMNY